MVLDFFDRNALCWSVYEISRFSEMRCFQLDILACIPKRDQLFAKQGHHIYGALLRGQTEKDSANMSTHAEILPAFWMNLRYFCISFPVKVTI